MKKQTGYIVLFCVGLIISSCQKIINIDLNSASPVTVIVGNINDQSGPYTVTLSQTVNFSQPNTFPAIDGAFITITDNTGIVDTLTESATIPGTYLTKKTIGVQGRTYTLIVKANGQTYTSVSTMPYLVNFDTLVIVQRIRTGFNGKSDTSYSPNAVFLDPPTGSHYYRFIETLRDTLLTNINVISDQFSSGKYINYGFRGGEGHSVNPGDSVKIEMQCIDYGTYEYLSTFREASGATNVTPTNPVSNISNNALGYFSAHTSRYRSAQAIR